jgi:hypothetical protein
MSQRGMVRFTDDFGSSQIGTLETLDKTRIHRLSLFQCCGVPDIRESSFYLDDFVRRIFAQTHQTVSRLLELVPSNSIPG